MKYFLPFTDIKEKYNPDTGSKAGNLSILKKNGYSVPDGFVLSAGLYEKTFLNLPLFRDFFFLPLTEQIKRLREVQEFILNYELPSELRNDIEEIISDRKGNFILRSACLDEDSSNYSFAGIYKSVPDLTSPEEIGEAIKEVWASLWTEQAFIYRRERGITPVGKMSLILQKQVNSAFSGVIFTKNPSAGEKEFVINVSSGMCEDIVSGKNKPSLLVLEVAEEEGSTLWKVKKGEKSDLLKEEIINELVVTARKIENLFKSPQDIEWTFEKKLYILQARPVTTTERINWSQEPVIDFIPEYLSPLSASFYKEFFERRFFSFYEETGIKRTEEPGVKEYMGRLYINNNLINNFFEEFYSDRFYYDYFPLTWNLLMTFPLILNDYKRKADDWLGRDMSHSNSIEELWENFLEIKKLLYSEEPAFTISFLHHVLNDYYNSLLPEDCHDYKDYFKALIPLDENTESYSFNKDFLLLLQESDVEEYINSKNNGGKPEKLKRFIEKYGHWTDKPLELAEKRYREGEFHIIELIRTFQDKELQELPQNKGPEINCRKVRELIEAIKMKYEKSVGNPEMADYFNRVVNWFIYLSNEREQNRRYNLLITEKMRRLFLFLGEKLGEKGFLEYKEDIFFLKSDEIEKIKNLEKHQKFWLSHINIVKKNFQEEKELLFPKEFTGPFPKVIIKETPTLTEGKKLKGSVLNRGSVTGKARVISNFKNPGDFKRGEILVVPDCEPFWAILFPLASGLVTERGGSLSHGAILAREYNIPGISEITDATKIIKTGDLISVNGDEGWIVVERANSEG